MCDSTCVYMSLLYICVFFPVVVYGVNTRFGKLARTLIPKDNVRVGPPLSVERTRMLLALRINVLAKGYSGSSMETVQAMVKAFNASCLSWVAEKGTVGATGDLAPLAHLTLGLMGEGRMWSPQRGWDHAKTVGLPTIPKDKCFIVQGIGLINGTQMMSSLAAEAVEQAVGVARQADIIAALSLEALRGTTKMHTPSAVSHSLLTTELNSATDNPLVFAERGETISGGNFHGEYPAKADTNGSGTRLSVSERRTERVVNPSLSELPAFLVQDGGLNSGFMIVHSTAATLVSESKALCHPSSVDSLSTSAATEDHVSMGGWAARKALRVVEHVEQVLAIELLAACQALEFLRLLKSTTPLEKVHELVRSVVWEAVRPYMDQYRDRVGLKPLKSNQSLFVTCAEYNRCR
uniref:Histidine ammonia-lyase n=1 Tax=Oncorhynchus mykiss TaxID=8022 RepID=A0A8K9WLV9_ONCMY